MADNMLHDWTKVVQENIEKQEINEWNLARFLICEIWKNPKIIVVGWWLLQPLGICPRFNRTENNIQFLMEWNIVEWDIVLSRIQC